MGGEAKLFCLCSFDAEAKIWLIEGLLNAQISRAGNISHFREQCVCVLAVSLHVISHDLNIDGCRQSKVQNLCDHVSWQESERNSRKLFRQCQTKLVNVAVRRMMFDGQSHQNVRVRCSNRRRVAVGQINATVGQAYVVNDALDLACRNLLSNRLLDLIAKAGRLFNAHSRGSTHVQLESTAVHAGEEVPAEPGNQNHNRADTNREEDNQKNSTVMEASFQKAAKAVTKFLECLLKTLLKSNQRIAAGWISGVLFFAPQ